MSQFTCPNCGKETDISSESCAECGHPFSSDTSADSAQPTKQPINGKKRRIIAAVLAAVVLAVIIVLCSICFHDWQEATCTNPSTCSKCEKTRGDVLPHTYKQATCTDPEICTVCKAKNGNPLGHEWQEATCTEPKTCSRCSITEGQTLPHTVSKWTTKTDPSCTGTGMKEGSCDNCGTVMSESIPMVPHTEGEWIVTKEAAVTARGEKTQSCTVCGEVLNTESFELSTEEIIATLKKAPKINYNDAMRYPEKYEETYGRFSGRVIQVINSWGTHYLLNTGSSKLVYVTDCNVGDRRVIEDDSITVYGVMDGTYSYTTVMGAEKTVPAIDAYYIP